jgi:hypothetical protein
MAATVRLVRAGAIGFELRRKPFEITIDGKEAASLEVRGTVEIPVEPGEHTLSIRSGRYTSRSVSFEVGDDEVASFRCHSALVWPQYVVSLIVPSLGITLRRE